RLLDITDLHVALPESSQRPYAVEKLDLHLEDNEILCVVGESGSGKSLTARAVMGLLPKPHVRISQGSVLFNGEDLASASEERLRQIRGSDISMIFQEPMTALNPVMTIGTQIDEVFRFHEKMPGRSASAPDPADAHHGGGPAPWRVAPAPASSRESGRPRRSACRWSSPG
ncbi:MAG: ATP-binding cassette domain-containing protein, partial [Pseudomonadota bacterium]